MKEHLAKTPGQSLYFAHREVPSKQRISGAKCGDCPRFFATRRLLAICAAIVLASLSHAQSIPRMPDGKPNLNGVWQHPYVPDMSKDGKDQKGAGELPFTPWGANNFKTYDPAKFDYTGHCLPFGLMRSINVGGYPIQIMQNDQYVALLFEQNTWFHVIYADGRESSQGSGSHLVRDLLRQMGRRYIRRRYHRVQRQDQARHHRPSAHGRPAPHRTLPAHRPSTHRLRNDHRRSQGVHQAVEEYPSLHAHEARRGTDRILLRRK